MCSSARSHIVFIFVVIERFSESSEDGLFILFIYDRRRIGNQLMNIYVRVIHTYMNMNVCMYHMYIYILRPN